VTPERQHRIVVAALVGIAGCHLPSWNGKVPSTVPRKDPCGSGAVTDLGRTSIHRRPYLQGSTRTGATVVWAGDPDAAPRIAISMETDTDRAPIAKVPATYAGTPADEAARRATFREEVEDYDDSDVGGVPDDDADLDDEIDERGADLDADELYLLAATVRGLTGDNAYCYRVEDNRGALTEWAQLTLAPPPDSKRTDRYVVLGDTGNGSPAQLAIARRISTVPMDALLFLGDIAYNSGTAEQLQSRFFEIYADVLPHVPSYVAIGNHDNRTAHGRPFEEAFVLPGNERWYSFDSGDVHFVVLDTMRIGEEQARWLDADLGRTTRQFVIVLAHHPPFSASRRGDNTAFQRWFVPTIERHHVELVLTGHEHHYERVGPIHGVQYIVSGGGGGRLTAAQHNGLTKVARAVHHYLTLAVRDDTLVVRAVDIDGNVFDEVTIRDR
jgi:hypothetical protein